MTHETMGRDEKDTRKEYQCDVLHMRSEGNALREGHVLDNTERNERWSLKT